MTVDPVIVIGVAGFGRETADVLDAMGIPISGFLDDSPTYDNLQLIAKRGDVFLGQVDAWLARTFRSHRYVIGIGAGRARENLATRMDAAGHQAVAAVHPSVTMGYGVHMGPGTVVCAGVNLSNAISLGRHVHINPNATIGHDVRLHDFVSVNPSATVSGAVEIGSRTLVGASATILQNLTIQADVTMGACALVTKNVPANVVVTGVPGRWNH